jgi:hypothetical protein
MVFSKLCHHITYQNLHLNDVIVCLTSEFRKIVNCVLFTKMY